MHSAGQNMYRNISDALKRLRSDNEYFSLYPKTSQCIAEKNKKTVGYSRNMNLNYNNAAILER